MRARLALCLGITLITAPTIAARLSLPLVPHYEAPFPSPPITPVKPPHFTGDNNNKGHRPGDTANQDGEDKTIWQRLVAIYNRSLDDAVTFFTAILVLANLILAGSTIALWQVTRRQARLTKITADATKLLAEAAIHTELPIIALDWMNLFTTPFDPNRGRDDVIKAELPSGACYPRIRFKNFGRTPAIIVRTCFCGEVVATLPKSPSYEHISPRDVGTVIENQKSYLFRDLQAVTFTEAQREEITRGDAHFWIFGFIEFEDFLRGVNRSYFCTRWVPKVPHFDHGGFVEDGPAAYRRQNERQEPEK